MTITYQALASSQLRYSKEYLAQDRPQMFTFLVPGHSCQILTEIPHKQFHIFVTLLNPYVYDVVKSHYLLQFFLKCYMIVCSYIWKRSFLISVTLLGTEHNTLLCAKLNVRSKYISYVFHV